MKQFPTPRGHPISRRAFHRCSASALVGAASGALTRFCSAEHDVNETKSFSGKYVDIHVHLGQPWNKRGPLTAEMLLRWMDAHDIAQACILSLVSPESWFYPITSQWVLEKTKPFRDRLIPFCGVDPRSVNLGGYKGILDILRRYVDAGAKGFGEHKWGGPVDDPRNIDLFRACAEVKLPVLFHLDNIRNTDEPGLPGLEKVLREVPEGTFIGHANGWWASISGETTVADMGAYPRGPIAPGGAIDRLMEKYPNIYGDLSAGSGANAIRRDMEFGREFLIRRADRLLFGTDYLAHNQSISQFEIFEKLDLPEEVKENIFRHNAHRLLSLAR